jgi:putative tricarboxylic transport membrane protein
MTDQAVERANAMKPSILDNKDVWAGLFLIVVGVTAVVIARNYTFGTALRMGPGFFPTVLGGFLILSGLYILASGLRSGETLAGSWSLRALIVLPLALALFGVLIDRAGFIPAMLVLIFGSGLAGTDFRLIELLVFSVLLTALCAIVFVWALGLPYPLIAGF